MPDFAGDAEFLARATEIVNDLENELRRAPPEERGRWRALEIGCGPGRLMRPMSRHFLEIHGFDVSADAVAQARENLRDLPQAHFHFSHDPGLGELAPESFDFIYSYDFFPRVDSRERLLEFLRGIHRVLSPNGLVRLEFSGVPGAGLTSRDLLEFAQTHDLQALAFSGVGTRWMWIAWRKHPAGWTRSLEQEIDKLGDTLPAVIRRITNASSFEPIAPCRGPYASISLRVENLPPGAGLNHLRVTIGGSQGSITSIGPPERPGLHPASQQIRVDLPEFETTGLLPVQVFWLDRPLSEPAALRVIPPGPLVPRIVSAPQRVEDRAVFMTLAEVARPYDIEVSVGGRRAEDLERVCTDPRRQRFELKFRLPEDLEPGLHEIQVSIGRRRLAPVRIETTY